MECWFCGVEFVGGEHVHLLKAPGSYVPLEGDEWVHVRCMDYLESIAPELVEFNRRGRVV
jgi:hypothetical protein